MLPYMAVGILQVLLNSGSWDEEIILDYSGGLKTVLIREPGRSESEKRGWCDDGHRDRSDVAKRQGMLAASKNENRQALELPEELTLPISWV